MSFLRRQESINADIPYERKSILCLHYGKQTQWDTLHRYVQRSFCQSASTMGYFSGFTKKYKVNKLVWYEETNDVYAALLREKQIKKWKRAWKIKLIKENNPDWNDLSINWFSNKDVEEYKRCLNLNVCSEDWMWQTVFANIKELWISACAGMTKWWCIYLIIL